MIETNLVVFLGPDRCGKTTAISKLKQENPEADVLHFTGPKPEHTSPYDQYVALLDPHADLTIADRGWQESEHLDQILRGYSYKNIWFDSLEEAIHKVYDNVTVYLKYMPWGVEMIRRHTEEILLEKPHCSGYYLQQQLYVREQQHLAYYKYMNEELFTRFPLRML